MKMKFAAATLLLGMLTFGLIACGPGGGGGAGASMLGLVPAGDIDGIITVKPVELFESEFLSNLTDSFPLFTLIMSQMKSQMADTAIDIEKLDMLLFAGSEEKQLVMFKADWAEEDLVSSYEDDKGVELKQTEYGGMSYWLDETKGDAMAHIGDVYVTGPEEMVKKVIDLNGGTGEKYADSEAFAKAGKYIDLNATVSFFKADATETLDFEMMKQQMAAEGEDEETIEAMTAAMEKLDAMGGSFKVTNAINGNVAMMFTDEASAKAMTDIIGKKKDIEFEKAADSLQAMSQMGINADKEKFMKLAEKITFSQSGMDMITKVNIAWADLAFLFETPAE